MMGDLKTSPYKIAEVFNIIHVPNSILYTFRNEYFGQSKANVFSSSAECRRPLLTACNTGCLQPVIQVVRMFKMMMEDNSYFLHMGTK